MEISKILTISTAHISKETADYLNKDEHGIDLIFYKKGDYGWFVYIPLDDLFDDYCKDIPKDLKAVIKFAKDQNCNWLCLDRDGEIIDYLYVYIW